jgi:hypothetical protein
MQDFEAMEQRVEELGHSQCRADKVRACEQDDSPKFPFDLVYQEVLSSSSSSSPLFSSNEEQQKELNLLEKDSVLRSFFSAPVIVETKTNWFLRTSLEHNQGDESHESQSSWSSPQNKHVVVPVAAQQQQPAVPQSARRRRRLVEMAASSLDSTARDDGVFPGPCLERAFQDQHVSPPCAKALHQLEGVRVQNAQFLLRYYADSNRGLQNFVSVLVVAVLTMLWLILENRSHRIHRGNAKGTIKSPKSAACTMTRAIFQHVPIQVV